MVKKTSKCFSLSSFSSSKAL